MALSEILDVLIAIVINLLTQSEFDLLAPRCLIPCSILLFLVVVHITCTVIQHNATIQSRNKKLLKAFQDHGGYDTVEEAVEAMGCKEYTVYHPVKKNHEVYEKLYQEYRTLHDYFGRGGNNVMKRLIQYRKDAQVSDKADE